MSFASIQNTFDSSCVYFKTHSYRAHHQNKTQERETAPLSMTENAYAVVIVKTAECSNLCYGRC